METIRFDIEHIQKFVTKKEMEQQTKAALKARETLLSGQGKGNDFLGWVDLPAKTSAKMMKNLREDVDRLASISQYVVVVGIGGSYLGARAVIDALEYKYLNNTGFPQVLYAGHTLDEDYYAWLLNKINTADYSVVVISKSGTTTEPAVAFRMLKRHLEKKYGKSGAAQRIVAITDKSRGALKTIADQEGYPAYVIPDNVGGRFSVLTPVGLLPIALAGYDISALLRGARNMRKICIEANTIQANPALLYAVVRNALYNKGKKVEMMVNFTPVLRTFSEWWKQLYGESEGKEGKGLLPHSLSFTTDLHSMGQYVQEGERLMFETVMSVKKSNYRASIPNDKQNLDGLNYLLDKNLTEINHCAEQGTVLAHEKGGVPVLRLELPKVNEEILGQMIYMFEFACGVSGYMLDVNPFDQPGVEAYKKNMFALLGKPGYKL
ncbi:MAG: glucose-6-phosphate isomerase [Bacteroidales bacterium]|nr:glucose-6-phosphate isomerase [Bacteroidales bacterium]